MFGDDDDRHELLALISNLLNFTRYMVQQRTDGGGCVGPLKISAHRCLLLLLIFFCAPRRPFQIRNFKFYYMSRDGGRRGGEKKHEMQIKNKKHCLVCYFETNNRKWKKKSKVVENLKSLNNGARWY